ncbi:Hypothetical_protein [Hexamita inflata]|uniref:Hypothetical_protein n=1 Tax=Hexamita inflata TaxID=28002 RepID=A0ABP1LVG5_9EUKA
MMQKDNSEVRFVIYKRVRSFFEGVPLFLLPKTLFFYELLLICINNQQICFKYRQILPQSEVSGKTPAQSRQEHHIPTIISLRALRQSLPIRQSLCHKLEMIPLPMATAKILVCEQFNLFSQITLVGVLIILSSLILLELFLLRWLHKLRELGDYLAFDDQTQNFICFNSNNVQVGTS